MAHVVIYRLERLGRGRMREQEHALHAYLAPGGCLVQLQIPLARRGPPPVGVAVVGDRTHRPLDRLVMSEHEAVISGRTEPATLCERPHTELGRREQAASVV